MVIYASTTIAGALSFADGWINAAHAADRAYYGTDTRALEFLVGAVLAVAIAGRTIGRALSRGFAIAGPFALVALVWANAHAHVGDQSLFRGGLLAYAGLGLAGTMSGAGISRRAGSVCQRRFS